MAGALARWAMALVLASLSLTVAQANALGLNSGAINDARDGTVAASLGLGTNAIANDGDHKVDGAQGSPRVTGVAILSPAVGSTFERGDRIGVRVTFNTAVDVGGTPQLALGIGSATRQASYASGTGTTSLVFLYTVVRADADPDGISIGANALTLNGGTINDARDGTTAASLGLGTNAITNSSGHKVDGATLIAPVVTDVSIESSPLSGSTYELGEEIVVRVVFNRVVDVGGTPQLALVIGTETRQASSGSGTTRWLVFRYTVVSGDADSNGLSVAADALGLNSGTINDARSGGGAASLGLGTNAIANDGDHKVDGARVTAPAVTDAHIFSLPLSSRPVTYELGDVIEVGVKFDRAVTVGGAPQLALVIGTETRQASYASGSGTRWLMFHYTVQASDSDANGLSVGASALTLNSGMIDVAGGTVDALLGLGTNAIADDGDHKVDGSLFTVAAVIGASITSTPRSGGSTYWRGEQIEVQLTFTRPVVVSSANGIYPVLWLQVGSRRSASYAFGSSTATVLVFRYTVRADADPDGISVGANALYGGKITDARDATVAASRGLGMNPIVNDGDHKVDGSYEPPGVTGVAIGAPVVGDTFERGDTIEVTVTFNKAVDVGGTPQLALGISSGMRQASYASGTGTASLVFRYPVVRTDADPDGLSIGADALGLNGGTINDTGSRGAAAILGLGANAITNSGSHKVAGGTLTAAAVSGAAITSSPAGGSTYGPSEQIEVSVAFNRPVTVTGTPQLALVIGTETRQANYVSGTGTDGLTFRYRVVAADSDANGLSVAASALGLNSGTITDARDATVAASLGLGTNAIANDGDHKVDGAQGSPGVTGVAIGSPVVGDTFERGDTIEVTVTFNKAVDVSGTPQLALGIASGTRQASYASGGGTASLVFRYTVASGDADTNGLSIAADALGLNSGTIDVAGGTTDALLGLGANAITNSGSHKVAGGTFTAAAVSGASIASSPLSGSTYGLREQIEVAVTFTRPVTVMGTPGLALGIGAATRRAHYVSGTGTDSLTFRWRVVAADSDANGLSVAANALESNARPIVGWAFSDARDGTMQASLGLGTNAITNSSGHKVDGSRSTPRVVGVVIGSPAMGSTFGRGDTIEVTVNVSPSVTVTGTPQLALVIGTQTRQADYASSTVSGRLYFQYVVQASDSDPDGISVGANALRLNGGTINATHDATVAASLGLGTNAITNSAGHKVVGRVIAPGVTSVVIVPNPSSGSTYERGEVIQVNVYFNRLVTVTGAPQLALGIGAQTRQADRITIPGYENQPTFLLQFRYTVQASDGDPDGLSIAADALTLNGGTVNDTRDGTVAASLGLGTNAITNSGGHKVDGARVTAPVVAEVWMASSHVSDGTYERGDQIEVRVRFNRLVTVTGTPQLALGIGAQTRQADYASGTGTAEMVFRYTVQASDSDPDGLSVGAGALTLNGGAIYDARDGTTAANLGLGTNTITNDSSHKVDGSQGSPVVTDVSIESSPVSDNTYGRGDTIKVAVTFNKGVDVSGTPQLALVIGTKTRQANYVSGTGTDSLTFWYTVVREDADTDGLSVGAGALTLNGGTINDVRSTTIAASLGLGTNAITNSSGHKVDGATLSPAAVSVVAITSSPAGGSTYGPSERIEVRVGFNKVVVVGGAPQLALVIGTETRQASYVSGTSTRALDFRYTVVQEDADTDGLSVAASALGLNGGTINDARSGVGAASLGLGTNAIADDGDHKVDGALGPPVVTGVAIGAPVVGDTFERGEQIEVTVTFNRAVNVTTEPYFPLDNVGGRRPQLALVIGTETRQASYASGGGTASLVFLYTVKQADADTDGLSIGANALTLNSQTIKVVGGTVDALLGLGTNAITSSSGHKVDGTRLTAPVVTDVSIESSPVSGSTYELGEQIEVTVTFNRVVDVSGTPQLALVIGTATRQASHTASEHPAKAQRFVYTVQASDNDSDGLSVGASALTLNGGTINDVRSGGGAASLGLGTNAIANDGDHKVDGSQGPPGVTGVAIGSPVVGDTFKHGDTIEVTVTFNKAVDVGGTPQLALVIGTETRQASYASGSSTASLVFRYPVALDDSDTDGLSIGADALGLNSGTIDVAGGRLMRCWDWARTRFRTAPATRWTARRGRRGDGSGDRRAGGGRHVRAGRYDRGDGDVQQGGGRGRHATSWRWGSVRRRAGVLRFGRGHGVAGVPLPGGVGRRGRGRG